MGAIPARASAQSGTIYGTPDRKPARSAARAEKGRVCKERQCSTILSTYNATEHCGLHEPFSTTTGRR